MTTEVRAAPILQLKDVTLAFGGTRALEAVSFDVMPGEILGIVGPNGAGKTSLLNCMNALVRPQSGRIYFKDKQLVGLPSHQVIRLGIGRTFQGVSVQLDATVAENILSGRDFLMHYGLFAAMVFWGPARTAESRHRAKVEEVIEFLEIERFRDRPTGSLPWGQQKLVEIGRALAGEPLLMLLDEPTSGMTREEKEGVARSMLRMQEEMSITQVLIEHDTSFVSDICDRIVALDFGRVIATGSPEEVLNDPQVAAAFLGVVDTTQAN